MGHPKQVLNSYKKRGEGNPIVYPLGEYKSVRCWEYAIPHMHENERFKMFCPEYFARGGESFYSDGLDSF